jgi:tripartite-type tricarboxylate transporter receptor subunit TctC
MPSAIRVRSTASGSNGTAGHVFGELFKMMAGVDLVHVPYRGSPPAIAGLLGGQVQVFFSRFDRLHQVRPNSGRQR